MSVVHISKNSDWDKEELRFCLFNTISRGRCGKCRKKVAYGRDDLFHVSQDLWVCEDCFEGEKERKEKYICDLNNQSKEEKEES